MEYYTSISPQAMPKDFTGLFLTSWDDSLWILKVFVNGDMIDFVDNIDPEEDSVEAIVYRYNLSIDDVDAEEFELFVDETLVDELEENLVNFPLEEEIDIFPDDDDDDDHDHEHCCHHHHDEDEHDHDHHHHHHDGEECDDPHCGCHHHHHHADEVFTSWGTETVKAYSEAELEHILTALDSGEYGAILRAKGIVAAADGGQWLHYDFVPEEHQVRRGPADYTGRICVIGSQLKEDKLSQLFGL